MSDSDHLWFTNSAPRTWIASPPRAKAFHAALPGYAPTPLVDAPSLAHALGVGRVLVKDESARFDLGAFKFLGASWGAFRALSVDTDYHGPDDLAALRTHLGGNSGHTLVTATDGNHGRAVARTARLLGLPAQIFLPHGVPDAVLSRISAENATTTIVDADYDGAVETAKAYTAAAPGRIHIQDMGWPGYEEIPNWIVEGYLTLTSEIDDQVAALGLDGVDLICVPIGNGTFGQAVIEHFRDKKRVRPTEVLAVEPDTAACLLASLYAGKIVSVQTGSTIANGLNCGTPTSTGWPWMRDGLSAAVAVTETQLREAIAALAGAGVASGPSGCASYAGLTAALTDPARRAALGATESSIVVALSTEGPIPGVA